MAKSVLDITLRLAMIRADLPAQLANEMRGLNGLEPLSVGERGVETLEPAPKKKVVHKIACEYCCRRNDIETDLCLSCGAPLPLVTDGITS